MGRCYMGAAWGGAREYHLDIGLKHPEGPLNTLAVVVALLAALCVVLVVAPLRRQIVSRFVLRWYRGQLPAMSQTEREAIDAGTVWWDGDLFSGHPDWNKLLAMPKARLTAEEQSFLDNECEQLCAMV